MSTSSVLVSPSRGARAATWPVVAVICAAVVVVGLFVQPQVAWSGILIAGFYGLTLALGVSIFAAINAVAGAKWCRPINLVFPVCGRTLLPALLAIGLVLLLGLGEIYHWSMPGVMENDHLLHQKHAWLNVPFFLARAAIVMLIFYGLTTCSSVAGAASPRPESAPCSSWLLL